MQQQYIQHNDEILAGERWVQWLTAQLVGYRAGAVSPGERLVSVVDSTVVLSVFVYPERIQAISRSMRYTRPLPLDGLSLEDVVSMAGHLSVTVHQLVRAIPRYSHAGDAGTIMHRVLAESEDVVFQRPQQQRPVFQRVAAAVPPHTQPPRLRLITCSYLSVSDDEKCAICLETSADTPQMEWAFAAGCALHRFHSNCIQDWGSSSRHNNNNPTCPMCRARLLVLLV